MIWSFANGDTGLFTGRTFSGSPRSLMLNTPAGHIAIEGQHDRLTRRVDLETGVVIDYQRPAAEIEADQREMRAERASQRIEFLERSQLRALREIAIDPGNAAAKAKLVEIEAQIVTLRLDLRG